MKKYFIKYEESVALREFGFDEECLGVYIPAYDSPEMDMTLSFDDGVVNGLIGVKDGTYVIAPLYQQAFGWIRDKYNISHEIHNYLTPIETTYWCNLILEVPNIKNNSVLAKHVPDLIRHDDSVGTAITFKSYEEAELACLKKAIEVIKKNKKLNDEKVKV